VNDPRLVELERLRWVPRQLVRSRDLRDQLNISAQLRWWHNRAVHDPFGVASGMEVTLTADAQSATVQPGVAYDCAGRALRLLAPRIVSLPTGHESAMLVARARDELALAEPELAWREAGRLDPREWVPLVRLTFETGAPAVHPLGSRARPLARPRLGYGMTPAEGTPWEPWVLLETPIGLQVTLDTRAAGFTDVPCYFAWLQWQQVASSQLPYLYYFYLAVQYLEEPAIDRFVFRVRLPLGLGDLRVTGGRPGIREGRVRSAEELVSFARGQQLSVCWLGIQNEGTSDGRHE
jgi:hypothetical protein